MLFLLVWLGCGEAPAVKTDAPAQAQTPPNVPPQTTQAAPPQSPDLAAAETLVRELYAPYLAGKGGPDLLKIGKLSVGLQAAWDKDIQAAQASGEMGSVSFDVMTNAQDVQLSELSVSASASGSGAVVTASFKNFDQPQVVLWQLIQEGGSWKIDNILPGNQDLRKLLATSP